MKITKKLKMWILVILLVAVVATLYLQFKYLNSSYWWLALIVFGIAYYASSWLKKH